MDESRPLFKNLCRPITILNTLHGEAQLFPTVIVNKRYHYKRYFTNQDIEVNFRLNNQPGFTQVAIRDHEDVRGLEFYH